MLIKEFNFLLKDTKSASDIKNSILPQINLKARAENIGYIAKVYDTQSKKIYLLVSDNVKTEKSLSANIFEISGGNSNSESGSLVASSPVDQEVIKNIVKDTLNANLLKANVTFSGTDSPSSNSSLVANANNGDTYLDTKTNEAYIKNNDAWQKINTETTDLNGTGTPISTATLGQTYKDNLTGSIYVYTLVNAEPKWKRLVNNVKEINSVSAKTLSGEGEPKTSTTDAGMSEVKVGDIYHDTITDIYYMCVNVSGSTLTWKAVSKVEKETEYPKVESNAIFGEIGGLGAGVAYLPETAATVGLTPMSGANDTSHENFGNFVDSNNNVFVCIPLMFYKADTDERNTAFYDKPNIYISYVAKEGYAPFYAFKKSDGNYVPCVFVSKYLMGLSNAGNSSKNQTAISKKNKDVVMSGKNSSSSSDYDDSIDIGKISGCENRNDHFFKAANSMNAHTVLHYAAMRFVYYMVAEAHMQAAVRKFGSISKVPSFICAYLDVEPYFPKGCHNRLSDTNDKSIKYTQGIYSAENCGMTGSCNKPEKTSFNGQKCGIVDMGGLADEVDAGYITAKKGRYEVTLALKGIDLLKSLNENTYTNTENYIQLGLKEPYRNRERNEDRVGNGRNPIFSYSYPTNGEDYAINDYNCDNFLIPLPDGRSRHGTTAYGQDENKTLFKDYAPVFVGSYGGDYYNSYGKHCGLLYFGGKGSYSYYINPGYKWSESSSLCSARAMIVPN